MKFRGHGNGIAIALGALAVVIAGSGTAVAVSSTTTISDPKYPSHIARVDGLGRVTTVDAMTTINVSTYAYPYSSDSPQALTSPTSATLGVTELAYDNSLNDSTPNNDFTVSLGRITVGSSNTCYDSDRTWTLFRKDGVRQGDSTSASFSSPVVFKAVTKPYCIGVFVRYVGTAGSTSYPAAITVGATVLGGTYTGAGLATSAADPEAPAPAARPRR